MEKIGWYMLGLLLVFVLGLVAGIGFTKGGLAEVERDLQEAEDRNISLSSELGRAAAELVNTQQALIRARGEASRASERADELAAILEREREALKLIGDSLESSDQSLGRLGNLTEEGQEIVDRLLKDSSP